VEAVGTMRNHHVNTKDIKPYYSYVKFSQKHFQQER
jgi:hypothetical protein